MKNKINWIEILTMMLVICALIFCVHAHQHMKELGTLTPIEVEVKPATEIVEVTKIKEVIKEVPQKSDIVARIPVVYSKGDVWYYWYLDENFVLAPFTGVEVKKDSVFEFTSDWKYIRNWFDYCKSHYCNQVVVYNKDIKSIQIITTDKLRFDYDK